jgi:hypothetical protein
MRNMADRPSTERERTVKAAVPNRSLLLAATDATKSNWKIVCFLATSIACSIGYVAYVIVYGVNVVFWDSWAWTQFVVPRGTTLGALWAQHNEARTFFPDLLALIVIHLTSWDDRALMLVSALLMIGCLGIIVSALWSEIRSAPLRWLPVPFLVLTLAQYENTLWSFQVAWPFALFFLLGSLRLLLKETLPVLRLCGAILLGVVASYSLFQGLLVWPAGLILLLSAGSRKRWVVFWIAAAGATTAGYFVGFNFAATSTLPLSTVFHHVGSGVRGLLIATGSVIPNVGLGSGTIASPLLTEIFGALLILCGIAAVVAWVAVGRPADARAFCVALIVVTLLFELLLVPGRLATDPIYGTSSRYDTFSWPLLVGLYGYAAISVRSFQFSRLIPRVAHLALASIVVASIAVSSQVGITHGRLTRLVRLTSADVLANLPNAPPWIVGPYLNPPCVTVPQNCKDTRALAAALKKRQLNVFANSANIGELHRLGIVPGGQPTRVLPLPSALVDEVNASMASRHAWNVLSAVYWTTPSLQHQFRFDRLRLSHLLAWAVHSGEGVTRNDMVALQWTPPVSAGFFLKPYVREYSTWCSQEAAARSC